jgi:GntR family transcriptional regulator
VPQTLHVAIADEIREQIRRGALQVGDPLPSESHLCRRWNSSRGPVRQALATLRAEGTITGGRGKPPVVNTAALAQPFDTLLSYTAWVRSIGRVPGQRTLELVSRAADPTTASRLRIDTGAPVVHELRLRFLDGAPAMLERASYIERVGRLLFEFDTDSGSEWTYFQSRGVHMATARHVIDAIGADAEDARHLEVAEGAPLLRQQRTARDSDGEILEYHDDRYLPEVVSFSLENNLDVRTALMRDASN